MKLALRFCITALCLLSFGLVAAQDDEDNLVSWRYTGLAVDYPLDWVSESTWEDNALLLNGDGIWMDFYAPITRSSTAAEELDLLIEENVDAFDFGTPKAISLGDWDAMRLDFTNNEVTGFSIALEYNELVLLVDSYVETNAMSSAQEAQILDILATLQPSDIKWLSTYSVDIITEDPEDIIAELVELEWVSEEGALLYSVFEPEMPVELDIMYEGGKVVVGGFIALQDDLPEDFVANCSLVAQADIQSEVEGTALTVGFATNNKMTITEQNLASRDEALLDEFSGYFDGYLSHHLIIIIDNGLLSIFVDGDIFLYDWELEIANGDGELGAGFVINEGCAMDSIWVYSFK